MKLFFALTNFPPSKFGGVATSMFSLIHELNNYGYDIKVLTTNYKIEDQSSIETNRWTKFEGISVYYVDATFHAFSFRFFCEGFRQISNAEQVHLSGVFYFPSLIFAIFAYLAGKPVFLSPHGELQEPALKSKYWKKGPYLQLLKCFFSRVIFRSTSEDESNRIHKFFPKSTIYNIPIFFDLERPLLEKKKKQFVFLGRICKIKKIENLILACAISKRFKQQNYTLLIAGPGDSEFSKYETSLQTLITSHDLSSHVKFVGEVNSPVKEELLSQSRALFLVSDSENFGNVVLEALAQGTPVVASKGTPWKSLETNNCGFWIDNSPDSIAAVLDELIMMDEDKYKLMSDHSIIHSKAFTKESLVPKWVDLIHDFEVV